MFRNKKFTLENTQTKFRRFFCIDWDGVLIYCSKIWALLKLSGNRDAMLSIPCAFMQSTEEYPGIFLDREPIKAREKHNSLVGYMLMQIIISIW